MHSELLSYRQPTLSHEQLKKCGVCSPGEQNEATVEKAEKGGKSRERGGKKAREQKSEI